MAMKQPFPESLIESRGAGAGPDFPGSSGDRERGKFRPSETPGLTAVAVVGDDGTPLERTTEQLLDEMLLYQKAMVQALVWLADNQGARFSVEELLTSVS